MAKPAVMEIARSAALTCGNRRDWMAGMISKTPIFSRTLLRALLALPLFLLPNAVRAEDVKPDTAEIGTTIAELAATYEKLGGFIATYQSELPGKSLHCTLATDFASGMGVIHLVATKDGNRMEMRQWTAPGDRYYVSSGGGLVVFKGLGELLESIRQLSETLAGKGSDIRPVQMSPFILLGESDFGAGLRLKTDLEPTWTSDVENGSIQSASDSKVEFLTEKSGLLTINRGSGMLERQSSGVENGVPRVMELKRLEKNPGKDAVMKISADWSTEGAVEKPVTAWSRPLRLALFQLVINQAELEKDDGKKLDDALEAQYEALRHFAEACMKEKESEFAAKADWEKLFATTKAEARRDWRANTPRADAGDEKGFQEYLKQGATRLKLREVLVSGMMEVEEGREPIMDDMFGNGGWASLKVGSRRGVAAKKSIVTALVRAYLEALIDQKMDKQWDRRDGLD